MELQVAQAINILKVLQDISEEDLPFKLAYQLVGIIEELVTVQKRYNDQVRKLYDKYIEKDEDGQYKTKWNSEKGEEVLIIEGDKEDDFNQEGINLLAEIVQVPIDKLDADLWESADIKLSLQELMALKPLFN